MKKVDVRPFDGLKVLELASVLAGPLAGSFLAEGGATVIKVEHPELGDITRSWRSEGEPKDDPNSAYFAAANTFKRAIKIDLANFSLSKGDFLPFFFTTVNSLNCTLSKVVNL